MLNTSRVLEFKSSTFFAPVLIILNHDIVAIEDALQEKMDLAPGFFIDSPLIIDLHELNKQNQDLDLIQMILMLRRIGFFPIGLRGGNEQQNRKARALALPIDTAQEQGNSIIIGHTTTKQEITSQSFLQQDTTITRSENSVADLPKSAATTILITNPIRSGQRIYSSGDLIILSQVSAGAEIMAEGNIHVYNTLRGRALAGVHGNITARIFCFDLQAELISIAGDYKTSEDLTNQIHKGPVQIYLQNHALIIKEIA